MTTSIMPTPESLELLNQLKESAIYVKAVSHEIEKRRLKIEELTQKLSIEQKNWVDEQWAEWFKVKNVKSYF